MFRDIMHCDTWKILLTARETIAMIRVLYIINGIRVYGPSGRMLAFLLMLIWFVLDGSIIPFHGAIIPLIER